MNLLITRFATQANSGAIELVQMSKSSADRLAKQIDDLLTYCRVGRNLGETTEVDVNQMIRIIEMELGEKIRDSKTVLTIENKLPLLKDMHTSMVHHVFQNLVANGIKFNTSANPTVKIDFKTDGEGVTFSVSDNGIGIDKRYEGKLFQMFKRLQTDDKFEGTGIGLAVCKKIVEFYSGKIWFESKPGSGTTFFFTLPKNFLADETLGLKQLTVQPQGGVINLQSRMLKKLDMASFL